MSARLKLVLAYDGAPFAGWQSQLGGNTIQDHLEKAFRRIAGKEIRVHGAGRTDAGVHALGQCAHADVSDGRRSIARWRSALNALLPVTIRVLHCRYVSFDFHARFSAIGKIYRYRVWTGPVLPPFEVARAWHVRTPLNTEEIRRAAQIFIGTHDFAGFAANRGKPDANTVRTIHSARVSKAGWLITLEFKGDGFLYKMTRLMVGLIVRYGLGKITWQHIVDLLHSAQTVQRERFAAPATGLILVRVCY
jgi:tRNA pseudouridine38-40 synthase